MTKIVDGISEDTADIWNSLVYSALQYLMLTVVYLALAEVQKFCRVKGSQFLVPRANSWAPLSGSVPL